MPYRNLCQGGCAITDIGHLKKFSDAPLSLKVSTELDIYPQTFSERLADLIDDSIGEGSPFHEAYGYYAQSIEPQTTALPSCFKGVQKPYPRSLEIVHVAGHHDQVMNQRSGRDQLIQRMFWVRHS